MRKTMIATTLLLATLIGSGSARADGSGPIVLSPAEMDQVTGGGVFGPAFTANFGPFFASSPIPIPPHLVNQFGQFYGPQIASIWTNGADPFSQYLATMGLIHGAAGLR